MRVLGIETSCDETAVAVHEAGRGIVREEVYSQTELHRLYGGVVPELAARDHLQRLAPMLRATLEALPPPDAIAYTAGPGLIGALLVGAALAQAFAAARGVPALAINHLEGHILAPLLDEPDLDFPFVTLLVSGGHTLLAEARGLGRYHRLGTTRDDAAGEAFDKTASLLGLAYPGGPALARLAEGGRPGRFPLPRPMLDRPGCDFSFSGLKTAVMYAARSLPAGDEQGRADLARAFEDAVVETLSVKAERALAAKGLTTLVVAGGVAANTRLRAALGAMAAARGARAIFPPIGRCTDNAAMIAYAGWRRFAGGERGADGEVRARWPLETLGPPAGPTDSGESHGSRAH
ncbi:MAG TPA: tRNA (adenosine(37)-N6)-threonylcarbamoyltransferase complex transferase subunit TsaD [Gammaproteobacteria bacterium]|nr:tRNA (adenosine(37)-N6)-threonylcarbamoyltransferase complex transferase subunit TsaD [Gammaproteobacteria bacterium]